MDHNFFQFLVAINEELLTLLKMKSYRLGLTVILMLSLLFLQNLLFSSETGNSDSLLRMEEEQTDSRMSFTCPIKKLKGERAPGRSKGQPIQFIHVPKAGGTSVQETLSKFATNAGIRVLLHDGDGPNYNPLQNRGLFLGHRGYGFSSKVKSQIPITIIALRDPVSRIISLFDYLRTSTEKIPVIQQIRKAWQGKTLDEVILSYKIAREKDFASVFPGGSASFSDRSIHRVLQSQIQFLCGYECVWYMTNDPRESMDPFKEVNENCLERARKNLELIDCIVTLDRLDDMIVQLKAHLDFIPKNFVSFPHDNKVSPGERSKPSEETLKWLKEWTKDEQKLFERAKELTEIRTTAAKVCLNT